MSFALWGFVMEEEYGFDLVLRSGFRWHSLLMMGIRVKVEIVVFCDSNLFLGLCLNRRPAGATFVKRKKIGICCGRPRPIAHN